MPPSLGSWHDERLRVRLEETDAMQIVYYSKFFVWMEVGRIGLLREVGLPHAERVRRGFNIPVVQAHADYKAPARFDEEVLVRTRVASIGRTSVKFESEIYRLPEMKLLCTGHTVHALTDGSGRSAPIPEDLRAVLTSS